MIVGELQETHQRNSGPDRAGFPPEYTSSQRPPPTKLSFGQFMCGFIFGEPKILGMMHIMAGLSIVAFGAIATLKALAMWGCMGILAPCYYTVLSGITFWGPLFYLGSGVTLIMHSRGSYGHLVPVAFYLNIFSCLTVTTAVVLLTVDLVWMSGLQCPVSSDQYQAEVYGIQGALFFFCVLEFSISVTGSIVLKESFPGDPGPPLNVLPASISSRPPPLYINEPLAGPYLPISSSTQGIYMVVVPEAPPPQYTP